MGVGKLIDRVGRLGQRTRIVLGIIGTITGGGLTCWLARFGILLRKADSMMEDSPEYAEKPSLIPKISFPGMPAINTTLLIWASGILLGSLLVLLILRIPTGRPDNPFDTDPQRLFTDRDREWINSCTQRRCEHRKWFGLARCKYKGEQLDHWYPWSKGGATSRHNLVNLCAKHNRRKSDHVPYWWQTRLLARARMNYFPPRWRAYVRPDGLTDTADRLDA